MLVLKNKQEYLLEAIKQGLPDDVLRFLLQGADVNAKGKDDETPLHVAVSMGHKAVVKLLIANGADVTAKAYYNRTSLHYASEKGYLDVAELLVAEGGLTVTDNKFELTPLYDTTTRRNIAKQLVNKKADVDAKDLIGETPLHYAARSGHTDLAELLIAKGADVNAKDGFGYTPLHCAATSGHYYVAGLLLAKGADINAKDNKRKVPLHYAAEKGYLDVAELLIAKGAEAKAEDKFGVTALHNIARERQLAALGVNDCPRCGKTLRPEDVTQFVQARVCDSCGWAAIWCYSCRQSVMEAIPEVWPDPQVPVQAWLECKACGKRGRADEGILSWLERHGLL